MMKKWKNLISYLLVLSIAAGLTVAGAEESASVALTDEAFPDPAFLLWAQKQDSDGDGFLSQDELNSVTKIDLRKYGIAQLDGLEYFRNVESLNCSENNLTELELDDFPFLTSLTCNENSRLETLDLSGAPALEHLYCFDSALRELDLQGLSHLTYLAWGGSPLQELDLSGNPELQVLHVLGGSLTSVDLSCNTKLDTLLWNHTFIEELDLSNQSELTYLNCTDNQITALDLSANSKLETVYAGRNRLLAIRLPTDDMPFCDLSEQSSASFSLPTGENGFSLNDLVPWADTGCIDSLTGGTIQGSWIQLDAPNESLTYRYTNGSAVLEASVAISGENGWKVPLSIADWIYGEAASEPQAQAAFGTVQFSYASADSGPFQEAPPTQAGLWYVRAVVEGTAQYGGLESEASFHIDQAIPSYTRPEIKSAVYGDTLSSVALDAGFFWENDTTLVGDAGDQTHYAVYIPTDPIDYLTVTHIPVLVHVIPYDGTQLPIPPISNRSDAEQLIIRHGEQLLQEGTDYTVSLTTDGTTVHVIISFQGNYTGTVTRSFLEESTDPGDNGGESGGGESGGESGSNGGSGESGSGGNHGGSSGGASTSQTFVITAETTSGGTITPNGTIRVKRGTDLSLSIQPYSGYRLDHILIDGEETDAADPYVFHNVSANHTISAVFIPSDFPADPAKTGVSALLDTVSHKAYLHGYSEDWFGPESSLTRAQAAQLFYSLLQNQAIPTTVTFSDVPADAWYADAVSALASLGIVSGIGDGRFVPDRPITRSEFLSIAVRFAKPAAGATEPFSDVHEHDWFYGAVTTAFAYGWIQGNADGTFSPGQLVTRAQAAVIVNRMLGRRADQAFLSSHENLQTFRDVPPSHWAYSDICEAVNGHTYRKTGQAEHWDALLGT